MKPMKFLLPVMIAAAGLVASCSTSKLAQTNSSDDVYNSVAKAREVEPMPAYQAQVQQQQQSYDDEYYGTSNPYYDMDYSSRINRFYNGYSWRGYYDPYFDNSYYYGNGYGNTNYLGYGLGWNNAYGLNGWNLSFGYGSIWSNPFYYGNFGYGWNNPYAWNAWGPNSYYDRYGWGGGYYGGGYYGGGAVVNTKRVYRASPGGVDNRIPRNAAGISSPNYGRPSRTGGSTNQNGNMNNRPTRNSGYTRQQQGINGRPTRNENYNPPTRTENRPTYSPPPSNNRGNVGSSGGGSYGGGSRGSRGGRG